MDELRVFLNDNQKIDILAINESKLDRSTTNNEISLHGFDVVRLDRTLNGRHGGGVCFYIRNDINFSIREDLSYTDLECLTVEISKPRSRPFLVSTWYRPPHSPPELFQKFETLIGKIDSENKEFYLLGDLNCNMLPGVLESSSNKLINIMDIFGLSQMITEPTRITESTRSLIDLCLTNSPEKVSTSGVIHVGISDHSLVYMTRKIRMTRMAVHKKILVRQFKHFDQENFLHDLSQESWVDVSTCNDPDEMWQLWKHHFMRNIDKHAPLRAKRISKKYSPWMTKDIITKIHTRDYWKRKHAKSNSPELWVKYKKARNQVNTCIKNAKRKYFRDNLDANKKDPKKTWKLINELQNRLKKSTTIPGIKINNKTMTSETDIAEEFNTFFTNVGDKLAAGITPTNVDPLSYIDQADSSFSFSKVNVDTVVATLQKLDGRKATGLDKIPSRLLKVAAEVVAPSLTQIFNKSISMGVFPTEWKLAKVTPIFKKGAKSDLNNYRPISVLPIVSKVFEKIIYDQLYSYLNGNNLLTSCQSGFRSLHSTHTALIEAVNSWCTNIDKGLLNGVIFIDLKKAFDTIDHKVAITKLAKFGLDSTSLTWFQSYLENRNQQCHVNGHSSSFQKITRGVPQGSLLGPLLFLIYINDLPNCLKSAVPRMYADDTSLSFAASDQGCLQSELNHEIENVTMWLKANKLSLNVTKTELMVIASRQKLLTQKDSEIDIHVDNTEIKRVTSAKSLGVYIDETLSWQEHVNEISKKISSGIGALKRIRPLIDEKTAVKVYKALIEPHFDYCSTVWDGMSQQLAEKLQKLQKRAARVITCSCYDAHTKPIFNKLGWVNLITKRKKQKAVMMYKTLNNLTPDYLKEMFTQKHTSHSLRDSEKKLAIPQPRTDYRKRSFSYSGSVLWNELPTHLRLSSSLSQFKNGVDHHFSTSDSHTADKYNSF